jgi:hypothetical protein
VLWDFNSIAPYTTEPIPPGGDTQTRMKWFWDPGHFKKELGDVMLDRAFAERPQTKDDFDTRLTPDTIEPHLQQLRRSLEAYLADAAGESPSVR